MDTSARPGPATDSCVVITAPSVDATALRLLETDPAAYFEQTHRPLPVGLLNTPDPVDTRNS